MSSGEAIALPRAYPALPRGQTDRTRHPAGIRRRCGAKGAGLPVRRAPHRRSRPRPHRPRRDGRPRRSRRACPEGLAIDGDEAALVFDPRQIHIYADGHLVAGEQRGRWIKPLNNRAWLLVLPVFAIVAFSAVLPLMTVVNYSVQDTFGNNQFFWNGVGWFQELLDPSKELGGRFFDALWRNLLFSAIILAIEIPLGIVVALVDAARGLDGGALPRADGAAAADPVERGRHDLAGLRPRRHRPARLDVNRARHRLQLRREPARRLDHHHRHGCLALDEPRRAALLCGPRSRSRTPIIRRRASTAPRAGRCSAPSSCRRCAACCSSRCCCASWIRS